MPAHSATAGPPPLALQKSAAARALDMSIDSFERHVQPDLPVRRVGSMRLFRIADLEAWLVENLDCAPSEELAR